MLTIILFLQKIFFQFRQLLLFPFCKVCYLFLLSIFQIVFFSILTDFECSGVSQTSFTLGPFSVRFRSWELFSWSGAIFGSFHGFWSLGSLFSISFYKFFVLCSARVVAFCDGDSGRNRQDFGKILAEVAKIMIYVFYICERQECSGVRRSSNKRTTIEKRKKKAARFSTSSPCDAKKTTFADRAIIPKKHTKSTVTPMPPRVSTLQSELLLHASQSAWL